MIGTAKQFKSWAVLNKRRAAAAQYKARKRSLGRKLQLPSTKAELHELAAEAAATHPITRIP